METQNIEIYIGYMDYTWGIRQLEVPINTDKTWLELLYDDPSGVPDNIAFVGLYSIEDEVEEV